MDLISTPHSKKVSDPLLELALRKQQLKLKIEAQENHINYSTKQLFTPASIFKLAFNLIASKTSVTDGLVAGFRIFKTIRNLFKK